MFSLLIVNALGFLCAITQIKILPLSTGSVESLDGNSVPLTLSQKSHPPLSSGPGWCSFTEKSSRHGPPHCTSGRERCARGLGLFIRNIERRINNTERKRGVLLVRGISRERNDTSWGGILEERGEKEMKDNKVIKVE
jgi:hypothetical protein